MSVFEVVYLLGDALTIEMVPLHLALECEEIEVIDYPTRRFEVGEQLPRGDEGVVHIGLLEFPDPHVFD